MIRGTMFLIFSSNGHHGFSVLFKTSVHVCMYSCAQVHMWGACTHVHMPMEVGGMP